MLPLIIEHFRKIYLIAAVVLVVSVAGCSPPFRGDVEPVRQVLSLNGDWEVEQGFLRDEPPEFFNHTVPVPALLSAASPPFDEVGVKSKLREAFWYRTTFIGPKRQDHATLIIHKAKYGIKVWLNGIELGGHYGSYTMASFDVTRSLNYEEENTLLVRVGAWRDSVPTYVPAAQDMEKAYWIPGIYDDVEVILSGTPHILRTKIEPDIDRSKVIVKTTLLNDKGKAQKVWMENQVFEWEKGRAASSKASLKVTLESYEEQTVSQTIALPEAHLWSPEDPFLYLLQTAVKRSEKVLDDLDTRFGMRKVEWRGGWDYDGRFYLNNQLYYLRGSNITLHRFFDDTIATGCTLPWDHQWVHQLLSRYPKELSWNTFRVCIGRAPNFWYDIADEEGLLLADEFMMWSLAGSEHVDWSVQQMEIEYTEWIQEAWNHPSIAWWDASNETFVEKSTEVIARVRGLDSTRQWENGGYNRPQRGGDPIEDHPYLLDPLRFRAKGSDFSLLLDQNDGRPPQGGLQGTILGTYNDPTHPYLINEYGYLWINRDGSPTATTGPIYEALLGEGEHHPEEYREAYAYLVGGLTEFWRARRGYAGVLHFAYLGYSREGGVTSDNFIDIENLRLEPRWLDYARSAFSPFMVYINSWRQDYVADNIYAIPVELINDLPEPKRGTLILKTVDINGQVLTESDPLPVKVEAHGKSSYYVELMISSTDKVMLVAVLFPNDETLPPVMSRRKIGYASPGERGPELREGCGRFR